MFKMYNRRVNNNCSNACVKGRRPLHTEPARVARVAVIAVIAILATIGAAVAATTTGAAASPLHALVNSDLRLSLASSGTQRVPLLSAMKEPSANATPQALPPALQHIIDVENSASETPQAPAAGPSGIVALLLLAFGALLVAVGIARLRRPSSATRRLARYMGDLRESRSTGLQKGSGRWRLSFARRAIASATEAIGSRLSKYSPGSYSAQIRHILMLRGNRKRLGFAPFLGTQAFGSVVGCALGLWLGATMGAGGLSVQLLLGPVLGAFAGAYLPYYRLVRQVSKQQRVLLRILPATLDFLAINVEAGMGLDAAIQAVSHHWTNELTQEFALLLVDFQIGKPRRNAWRDFAHRTDVQEISSFVTAVLQNEQVGGSIGPLLRAQAAYLRTRRRQRAEEIARVAPVKMLVPMVLFIFPSILIVLLAPAVLQFIGVLGQGVLGK